MVKYRCQPILVILPVEPAIQLIQHLACQELGVQQQEKDLSILLRPDHRHQMLDKLEKKTVPDILPWGA